MEDTRVDNSSEKRVGVARMLGLIERYVWNSIRGQLLLLALLFTVAFCTNHVSTGMLKPGSKAAKALLPSSTITKTQKGYQLIYRAHHRRIHSNDDSLLLAELRYSTSSTRYEYQLAEITIEAANEVALTNIKQQMAAADVVVPGSRIIQGRLIDEYGKPIAKARVDLMGDYCMINYCQTRSDGTFLLIAEKDMPKRSITGYLRFRTSTPRRVFYSESFTLDKTNPVACIYASRNFIEKYKLLWVLATTSALFFAIHDVKQWLRKRRRIPGTCLNCGLRRPWNDQR